MGTAEYRILVAGPAWVGDMVMAHSLIQVLHRRHQDAVIDVLAPHWSLPLVARMPGIRQAVAMPLGHGEFGWSLRYRLGVQLRAHDYHRAIVVPRSFKAALVPFHARIPVRTGYLGESRYVFLNDIRKLNKQQLDSTQKRFVALALERDEPLPQVLPRPQLQVIESNVPALRQRFALHPGAPVVALMPGAEYGPAKQWPIRHFRALAAELAAAGVQVVVMGSAKEKPVGAALIEGLDATAINLCGETTLVEAVDMLSSVQVAVTNDSGLMHVAAAVGTPVVAIYGSSSPVFTPPLTARREIVYRNLQCSPCFKRSCPLGHTHCLEQIDPGEVMEKVRRFLDRQERPAHVD